MDLGQIGRRCIYGNHTVYQKKEKRKREKKRVKRDKDKKIFIIFLYYFIYILFILINGFILIYRAYVKIYQHNILYHSINFYTILHNIM